MHIAALQIFLDSLTICHMICTTGIVGNMLPMTESQITKPLLRRNVTCVYSSSDNLTAHCTHTAFEKVPRNLNPEIQELTMRAVSVHQFDETSFSPYKKLKVLNLICISLHNTKKAIYENAFENLTQLHTLKLDTIFTKFNASLKYPPNLQNLSLNDNDFFTEVDLQRAPSLTSFYAQRCSLLSFPKFNLSAPIETVDVRWNPMDNWTAEDLAPLCQLKMIYIEWDENTSSLPKPYRYCQCIRLEKWIKINDITTSNPLNCTPPGKTEKNETCNMEYSEHMMNQYRKCMGGYSSTLNIILGTSMLTVVASSAGYRAKLVSTKPLDKAKVKSSKKIDRKKNRRPDANTTKAPEKTERGGDADIEGEKDSAKEEEEEEEEEGDEEEEGEEEDEQGEEEYTDTGEEDTNTEEELAEQDEETENKLVHGIQTQR